MPFTAFVICGTGSGGVGPLRGAVLDDNDDEQHHEQDEKDHLEVDSASVAACLERVDA